MAIVSVDLDVCYCENDFFSAVCKEIFVFRAKIVGFNLDILTNPNICRMLDSTVRLLMIVDHVTLTSTGFTAEELRKISACKLMEN